jgi:hypothetical protein
LLGFGRQFRYYCAVTDSELLSERAMRGRGRLILGAIGLLSWLAGGVAAFVSENGGGAAALVAGGAVAGAFAAIGRWPTRVVVSGHELSWERIRQTVDSQIQVVQEDRPDAVKELTVLRQRLDRLQRTGQFQRHPAEDYDDAVAEALRRVAATARLLRSETRSRQVPDFELVDDGRRLYVETKWRTDPRPAFRGDTLPQLLSGLPPGAALLVITNSADVSTARESLATAAGIRTQIVSWNDESDDGALRAAVSDMLALG